MNKHKFYHATHKSNKESIITSGLHPMIGKNSQLINESDANVYLFNSAEDLDTALGQWFGDLFEEDDELIIIEVLLDINDPLLQFNQQDTCYESTYRGIITPDKFQQVMNEDMFYILKRRYR